MRKASPWGRHRHHLHRVWHHSTRRLYFRLYIAVLGSLAVALFLFAGAWGLSADHASFSAYRDALAELASTALPTTTQPIAAQQRALLHWQTRFQVDLTLYDINHHLIAAAGRPIPFRLHHDADDIHTPADSITAPLQLPDGRWLLIRRTTPPVKGPLAFGVIALLSLIAVGVGVGAYPLIRRLTRRLETLQTNVEEWGNGNLSRRVNVEGHDEVARVASSFNLAAEKIETLMRAQQNLLANASHELRSPLARIRMASELLSDTASPTLQAELRQNISELDQLVDEILLASRLEASQNTPVHTHFMPLDLTALLAEECARIEAQLILPEDETTATHFEGDARLLRRLIRNLLENAQRHGGQTAIHVHLRQSTPTQLTLTVTDHGPGIPEAAQTQVFEPFYRLPGSSERSGGVGLGLSLVQQIAQQHGGTVRCFNAPEKGACFEVTLPLNP